jgi:hypothetical protein
LIQELVEYVDTLAHGYELFRDLLRSIAAINLVLVGVIIVRLRQVPKVRDAA